MTGCARVIAANLRLLILQQTGSDGKELLHNHFITFCRSLRIAELFQGEVSGISISIRHGILPWPSASIVPQDAASQLSRYPSPMRPAAALWLPRSAGSLYFEQHQLSSSHEPICTKQTVRTLKLRRKDGKSRRRSVSYRCKPMVLLAYRTSLWCSVNLSSIVRSSKVGAAFAAGILACWKDLKQNHHQFGEYRRSLRVLLVKLEQLRHCLREMNKTRSQINYPCRSSKKTGRFDQVQFGSCRSACVGGKPDPRIWETTTHF